MNSRDDRHDGEDTHAQSTTDTKGGRGYAEENRENEMRRTEVERKAKQNRKKNNKNRTGNRAMKER